MPGMAANPSIFEHLKLPEAHYDVHYLEWILPKKNETIAHYAGRMNSYIKHDRPILIGVSFGGILVQEMAKLIPVRKLIIISSVKSQSELPKKMMFAKYTKAHKLLPTGLVQNVELLAKYAFGDTVGKRMDLYKKYLSVRDKYYLDWAIDQIVNWQQKEAPEGIVHIHGDKDTVFPLSHISNAHVVPNATHTLVVHRFKWLNDNLPTIIEAENSCKDMD
jgi:pimeloyl-ACP methyl ester carboxylesterase